MPVILASIFSIFIVFMTVFSIIKVLHIGYNRKEITRQKYIGAAAATFMIGVAVSLLLPIGFQKVFDLIM
ncbi:hypothetical protein A8F94_18540 [Bacillus sp. FJAT-27225]|uniref:hypothetical protein n=1 Tax=Bacillus sp. FJAT-27225 TaxID=1743144 RepID=UPI00080C2AD1|nr:hypothetical protein [Bacillus sp. FJAT-27225]OCA83127.1 hypothetical protein A8F94_18540 [Bacillus sp. FJAT-27225]